MPAKRKAYEEISVHCSGGVYAATFLFVLRSRLHGGLEAAATADNDLSQ